MEFGQIHLKLFGNVINVVINVVIFLFQFCSGLHYGLNLNSCHISFDWFYNSFQKWFSDDQTLSVNLIFFYFLTISDLLIEHNLRKSEEIELSVVGNVVWTTFVRVDLHRNEDDDWKLFHVDSSSFHSLLDNYTHCLKELIGVSGIELFEIPIFD